MIETESRQGTKECPGTEMTHEQAQQHMCQKHGSTYVPAARGSKVGLAIHTLDQTPVYGVREAPEGDTCGWHIWAGPHSDAPDFFKPVHADHLAAMLPIVQPFLGLEPGFKFITDINGYEDVWRESMTTNSQW
jgi:hypothetical protein